MTTEYETHDHDVLIIGAGGAGLRAALGALAQGAKVGVVCKSLLGKAHTVMAEGGIAAAMANVDSADDWRTHFRDTMRGGKLLNNWRMAQIHAQEAPERVRELEQWGALFDRTHDGQILQRALHVHVDATMDGMLLQGPNHLQAGAVADVRQTGVAVAAEVALEDQPFFGAIE